MPRRPRTLTRSLVTFALNAALFFCVGLALLLHPSSPLPPEWRPSAPLRVDQPITLLTQLRLRMTAADPAACRAALTAHDADVTLVEPLDMNDNCHIENRVQIRRMGQTELRLVETSCETALRLAMWEEHSLQPLATERFGTHVSRIDHIGSFSCRQMRTSAGNSNRWSSHATASAIDVSAFELNNDLRIIILEDWDNATPEAEFLRAARNTACRWFPVTLGPDYNALHADHFHLQSTGWGLCR